MLLSTVTNKFVYLARKEKHFFMGIIEILIREQNSSGKSEESLAITNENALLIALFIFSGFI